MYWAGSAKPLLWLILFQTLPYPSHLVKNPSPGFPDFLKNSVFPERNLLEKWGKYSSFLNQQVILEAFVGGGFLERTLKNSFRNCFRTRSCSFSWRGSRGTKNYSRETWRGHESKGGEKKG